MSANKRITVSVKYVEQQYSLVEHTMESDKASMAQMFEVILEAKYGNDIDSMINEVRVLSEELERKRSLTAQPYGYRRPNVGYAGVEYAFNKPVVSFFASQSALDVLKTKSDFIHSAGTHFRSHELEDAFHKTLQRTDATVIYIDDLMSHGDAPNKCITAQFIRRVPYINGKQIEDAVRERNFDILDVLKQELKNNEEHFPVAERTFHRDRKYLVGKSITLVTTNPANYNYRVLAAFTDTPNFRELDEAARYRVMVGAFAKNPTSIIRITNSHNNPGIQFGYSHRGFYNVATGGVIQMPHPVHGWNILQVMADYLK